MTPTLKMKSARRKIFSIALGRDVTYRFSAPEDYLTSKKEYAVLLMNDGQDYEKMKLAETLENAFNSKEILPFIYIGIETNANRMKEYGIASSPDFKERGARANLYRNFIIKQFIPFLKTEFPVSKNELDWVFCGMSLGGLSAFDIAYNNPHLFGKVGVFSGSFWWRSKPYVKNDWLDRSRLVLEVVKKGKLSPHLKYWFQCGTLDEKADRNKNGIIDAIDDTQDLIAELRLKNRQQSVDITYVEVLGGKHDLPTWGKVFPQFIEWAFGQQTELPK